LASRLSELHWGEGEQARRRYVTAAFMRLNLRTNTLEVVNAGHNPVVLLSPDGRCRRFTASSPPLGILPGLQYRTDTAEFEAEARLLAFTDGLTEVSRGDEEFGEERLISTFQQLPFDSGDLVLEAIWRELTAFSSEPGQSDDMTALAIRRLT
jgi:serine phosphatase RsbU (regulator of sigma subunit)